MNKLIIFIFAVIVCFVSFLLFKINTTKLDILYINNYLKLLEYDYQVELNLYNTYGNIENYENTNEIAKKINYIIDNKNINREKVDLLQ